MPCGRLRASADCTLRIQPAITSPSIESRAIRPTTMPGGKPCRSRKWNVGFRQISAMIRDCCWMRRVLPGPTRRLESVRDFRLGSRFRSRRKVFLGEAAKIVQAAVDAVEAEHALVQFELL